jgi:hypothetical protein
VKQKRIVVLQHRLFGDIRIRSRREAPTAEGPGALVARAPEASTEMEGSTGNGTE